MALSFKRVQIVPTLLSNLRLPPSLPPYVSTAKMDQSKKKISRKWDGHPEGSVDEKALGALPLR